MRAAERELAVLDGQLEEGTAALAAARAALATARLNLQYTTITAPQDGVIGRRQVKPGQLVGVGTQITTLTPLPKAWVVANYKETGLPAVEVREALAHAAHSLQKGRTEFLRTTGSFLLPEQEFHLLEASVLP